MTIDEMWTLQARLISLECAFQYYKLEDEYPNFHNLICID